jgi:hypothetical protein
MGISERQRRIIRALLVHYVCHIKIPIPREVRSQFLSLRQGLLGNRSPDYFGAHRSPRRRAFLAQALTRRSACSVEIVLSPPIFSKALNCGGLVQILQSGVGAVA